MIRWLVRRRLDAFERAHGYDVGYVRDLLAVSGLAGVRRYARVASVAHHRDPDLPLGVWHAAVITVARDEDCGSCLQLVLTQAERAGVDGAALRALLEDDAPRMGDEIEIGWRYARAVLARAADVDTLRDQIAARWGRRAALSLAFAIATHAFFPRLKYALGHGHACTSVRVGDRPVHIARDSGSMTT